MKARMQIRVCKNVSGKKSGPLGVNTYFASHIAGTSPAPPSKHLPAVEGGSIAFSGCLHHESPVQLVQDWQGVMTGQGCSGLRASGEARQPCLLSSVRVSQPLDLHRRSNT